MLKAPSAGGRTDDGLSLLSADDYVAFRVHPTMVELKRLSWSHERVVYLLEMLRLLATMGAVLAALLQKAMLVTLVVAFVASITHVLDYHQFTARLQAVNAALGDLRNLMTWWESLDMVEKRMRPVKEHLVEVTEAAARSDFLLWASRTCRSRPLQEFQASLARRCTAPKPGLSRCVSHDGSDSD